jgi:hypothetical protein
LRSGKNDADSGYIKRDAKHVTAEDAEETTDSISGEAKTVIVRKCRETGDPEGRPPTDCLTNES